MASVTEKHLRDIGGLGEGGGIWCLAPGHLSMVVAVTWDVSSGVSSRNDFSAPFLPSLLPVLLSLTLTHCILITEEKHNL